jgi:hypothetical protein
MEDATMSRFFGGLALAAIAGAAWCWTAGAEPTYGVSLGSPAGGRELITHFLPADGKPTTLTIVDPHLRSIGVYQINRETGEIDLKSVRNFSADLQMDHYNNSNNSILPQAVRQGLDRQPK